MKRRNHARMTAIHVSIPVEVLANFDATLRFSQSRSAKITRLMIDFYEGNDDQSIYDASTRQLMAAITARDDCDNTLKVLLLQVLSQSS